MLSELKETLYKCPDKFGVFEVSVQYFNDNHLFKKSYLTMDKFVQAEPLLRKMPIFDSRQSPNHPTVSLANAEDLPQASFPTRRAWTIKVVLVANNI